MRKAGYLLLSSLALVLALTACQTDSSSAKDKEASSQGAKRSYGEGLQLSQQRDSLYRFIADKMTGAYGVYTNLQETDQSGQAASGHEVLSESAGILMRYYALTGQRDKFDQEWALVKKTFDLPTGFSYRYTPRTNTAYALNAAVDDLRILRALTEAGEAFHTDAYKAEIETYGNRFYQFNVNGSRMYDFYDNTYKLTNSFVTLCYADIRTLQTLPVPEKKKKELANAMLQVASGGYISDQFPFYQSRYDYKTESYQSDSINTVESLLTILELAEVQQHRASSIQFVKQQVKAGTLYGQYSLDGKPLNDVKSTAIYAIAAMIGSVIGDQDLYQDSIGKMNEFQIRDAGSALDGGFGDPQAQQAYSFDNLMALLAYIY